MSNLLRAEIFKLNRNKTFWTLSLFIMVISTFMHFLIVTDWWVMTNSPFEYVGMSDFNALATFIVPLFFNVIVSTLAGFFIATEFSQHSVIKNQIVSGHKRSHIFLAKYIVFTIGSLLVTIVIPLVTAIVVSMIFGHAEFLSTANVEFLSKSYGLFTLPFLSFTLVVLIIAIVTEDSGRTIIFTLLLSAFMFVVEKLVTNSFIKSLYEYTFFYQFTVAFNPALTGKELTQSIIISTVSFIVLIILGKFIFKRKEIK